jgi:sugar lactone lactonase YvrE
MSSKIEVIACEDGSRPTGPTFVGGMLYYADAASGDIRFFDVEANSGAEHEVFGNSGGQPTGLATDSPGADAETLYVSDLAHMGVVMLSKEDLVEKVLVEYEKKSLQGATSIAVSPSGSMFFCDGGPIGDTSISRPKGSVFVVDGDSKNQFLRPLAHECLAGPSGICVSPNEKAVFVCETLQNRLLRFVARPGGTWHCSVFSTFSGGVGPVAVTCRASGDNDEYEIFVARMDFSGVGGRGVVSTLSSTGERLGDIILPSPELTGLVFSDDQSDLFVTEASTSSIFRVPT